MTSDERDTQRQLDQLTRATVENTRDIAELRITIRDLAEQTNLRLQQLADENRATNERVDKLVSAVGALTQLIPPRQ